MLGTFAEVTSLPVVLGANGTFLLSRKFIEGMSRYADRWPGPVVAVMHPTSAETNNLDHVEVRPEDLRFGVRPYRFDGQKVRAFLSGCGFVHWGPHHLLHDLADVLGRARVPNVYCTEYTLRTRRQIIDAEGQNPIVRMRRYLWELAEERRIRKSLPRATGFEANGTPTFEAYGSLHANKLLYFDTRMEGSMAVSEAALEARLERLTNERAPLHLLFSGRLNRMKGALDLIDVAGELRRRAVEFRMSICGGGDLEAEMRARIRRERLEDQVQMRGVLPFAESLVPFVREEVDLFLCCHKQGDPSCTYLETFACGVPIIGYRNEAFAGLLREVDAGWGVALHDRRAMADVVTRLARDRQEIARKSWNARAFGLENTFERTFDRRAAFFLQTAGVELPVGRSRSSFPP